ncbi:MAG: glycosyltransferase, partial [Akkermansia muciniphila]|nr:glycosyltransferase [Akkermansia muciniphila]
MKIMHLIPTLSSGGVEQVVLELCQGLGAQGVECVVVSGGGGMVPMIEATGARHIAMSIGKKSLRTFFLVGKLAKLIRAEKPDVLHLHSRV